MTAVSTESTLELVAGHCYAMQVTGLRDHAFAHKSVRTEFEIVRTSRLTFLAFLTFEAFPGYREAISFYAETGSPDNNAHPLGTAFVDAENAQITVIQDAATIAGIIEALRNEIELTFKLTGLAATHERLEIVEFCYDYEF